MGRGLKRVALAASTTLTLAAALLVGAASAAGADPPVSCTDDIPAYLVGIGVNPDDAANAICQEGLRNYAGPRCPGKNWTCARADRPIVQIADSGGTNLFHCTSGDCLVVQLVAAGQNTSACERSQEVNSEAVALQECWIVQENTTGANAAGIAQHIQQTRRPTQRARQVARIDQDNATGSNIARIIQGIGQSSRTTDSPQIQEAHQAATVTQTTEHGIPPETSTLGDNTSNIRQIQDQLQRASGSSVSQMQNTELGTVPTEVACDQPNGPYNQEKNQCASVTQHSGVLDLGDPLADPPVPPTLASGGGRNSSTLDHQITQRQAAPNAESGAQFQGAFSTGEGGDKQQLSTGVSTGTATQDALQVQTAKSDAAVVQDQDTGDPRCCWEQLGNPANTAEILQRTDQSASSPDAFQTARFIGQCESTGTCHVLQSSTIDGEPQEPNECGPQSVCEEFYTCVSGEGEAFCFDPSEG
jgi:hypothetical protein